MLARVESDTPEAIRAIALNLGYVYGGKGSVGKLLDAIADGEVVLVQAITTETVAKVSRSKKK